MNSEINRAYNLGVASAKDGAWLIPAHNAELCAMLDGEPVGGKGVPLMRAYLDGQNSERFKDVQP